MQITPIYSDTNRPMKIFVLASGRGTNFESIYSRQAELKQSAEKNFGSIEHVFSNNPNAVVLKKAQTLNIKTSWISSENFFTALGKHPSDEDGRTLYDSAVISLIEKFFEPDLIVLAGYRRKLSRLFTERFTNKIINLYPGDTTKNYLIKGKSACVQAIENGEKTIRCTTYLENNPEIRFGTVLAQSADISLEGFDIGDEALMEEKIRQEGEWKLFPFLIHDLIANGRIAIDKKNNIYIDSIKAGKNGFLLSP